MAAPTLVGETHTSGTGISSLAMPTLAVGDLIIINVMGTNIPSTPSLWFDSGFTSDAGFTAVNSGATNSGNVCCARFAKVAVAGDSGKTVYVKNWPTSGNTGRVQAIAFNHALGWPATISSAIFQTTTYTTTSGSGAYTVATLTDCTLPCVDVTAVAFGAAVNNLTIAYDGGSSVAPTYDENALVGACQSTYKLYDTADTPASVAYTNGLATAKMAVTTTFTTSPAITHFTAKAPAANSGKAVLHSIPPSTSLVGKAGTRASAKAAALTVTRHPVSKGSAANVGKASGMWNRMHRSPAKAVGASIGGGSLSLFVHLAAKTATSTAAKVAGLTSRRRPVAKTATATGAKAVLVLKRHPLSKSSTASSAKATLVVSHRLSGKTSTASGAKATIVVHGSFSISGKAGTASSAKAALHATRRLTATTATASSAKAALHPTRHVSARTATATRAYGQLSVTHRLHATTATASGGYATIKVTAPVVPPTVVATYVVLEKSTYTVTLTATTAYTATLEKTTQAATLTTTTGYDVDLESTHYATVLE